MLEYLCKLQYVGCTFRPLLVRVREHINNIKKGKKDHSVPKHFREVRGNNIGEGEITSEPSINVSLSGETKVLAPRGLNIDFDLNCFIKNN